MVKKEYEDYRYLDLDNIYTYPKSTTLRNKFNEENNEKLRN